MTVVPGGRGPGREQPPVRASDADRDAVVARLAAASAEGRLTLEELGDRVDGAYRATVQSELAALVVDLPSPSPSPLPVTGSGGRTRWWVSPIGGFRRRGHYKLPEHQVVLTLLGGMDVDLRGAELSGPTATMTVVTVLGGADVVVPAGVQVDVSGFSILGGRDVRLSERAVPGAPLVHLRLYSILGGAKVRSKARRDRRS